MTTVTQSTSVMTQAKQGIAFTLSDPAINTLYEMTRELTDLAAAAGLQSWDQQTQMAMGSNKVRAPQMTTLRAVIHERQTAPRAGPGYRGYRKSAGRRSRTLHRGRSCPGAGKPPRV